MDCLSDENWQTVSRNGPGQNPFTITLKDETKNNNDLIMNISETLEMNNGTERGLYYQQL
jgi:hypothetical protein